jgi:DNA-binding NarL/FixJ family response regulator
MAEPHMATAVSGREQAGLRILIGENNADLATTLNLLLDSEPDMHCVDTANSSEAVLRGVDEHAPNAFILDLSLDDGSSLPLIRVLRERLPRAAIVVFTGHKNEMLNEQCVLAGANSVVVKTSDFEKLTAALREAAMHVWSGAASARPGG